MTCKDCHHHLHNYHDKYVCTNKDSDCYGLNTDDDDSCVLCESEWIRVEDGLPEQDVNVLTYSRHDWYDWRTKTIHSIDCYYIASLHGEEWLTDGFDPCSTITVTHWMPLIPPED